jgi:hypothetical protein
VEHSLIAVYTLHLLNSFSLGDFSLRRVAQSRNCRVPMTVQEAGENRERGLRGMAVDARERVRAQTKSDSREFRPRVKDDSIVSDG